MSQQSHETAYVESGGIVGNNTVIGSYSLIESGCCIGEECQIGCFCHVEKGASLGSGVKLSDYVSVGKNVILEDNVYCGRNVIFQNSLSNGENKAESISKTYVRQGSYVGDNADLAPGITVGEYAHVEPLSVVTRSVPSHGMVSGAPATQKGWVCKCGKKLEGDNLNCSCGKHYVLLNSPRLMLEEIK